MERVAEIGIVGGSGLQRLADHAELREVRVETPWGAPSAAYRVGTIAGRSVAFLARHGDGHRLSPSEIDYRANVWGFKLLGVERLVSCSAVGSLREEVAPLDFVVVEQLVDRTVGRASTFFGDGLVAHVSLADPTCHELSALAAAAGRAAGVKIHEHGTYVCMEGPQFSTRAESRLHRSWGADVIGMTNGTEAKLAREAEICYASVAMVTDYDCWHESEEDVTVEMLVGNLGKNAESAGALVGRLVAALPASRGCACGRALDTALITDPAAVPEATRRKLEPLVGRFFRS